MQDKEFEKNNIIRIQEANKDAKEFIDKYINGNILSYLSERELERIQSRDFTKEELITLMALYKRNKTS